MSYRWLLSWRIMHVFDFFRPPFSLLARPCLLWRPIFHRKIVVKPLTGRPAIKYSIVGNAKMRLAICMAQTPVTRRVITTCARHRTPCSERFIQFNYHIKLIWVSVYLAEL